MLKLTPTMEAMLRQAPDNWAPWRTYVGTNPANTLDALQRRGLVQVRMTRATKNSMGSIEWRKAKAEGSS